MHIRGGMDNHAVRVPTAVSGAHSTLVGAVRCSGKRTRALYAATGSGSADAPGSRRLTLSVSCDFLRAAVFLWISPRLTFLSMTDCVFERSGEATA